VLCDMSSPTWLQPANSHSGNYFLVHGLSHWKQLCGIQVSPGATLRGL